jgi:broad-specificity NMP kinase
MNKVYDNIDAFIMEVFPEEFKEKKDNDMDFSLQEYIDKISNEFSSNIEKIIKSKKRPNFA